MKSLIATLLILLGAVVAAPASANYDDWQALNEQVESFSPANDSERWEARRSIVQQAIDSGQITTDQAIEKFMLSSEDAAKLKFYQKVNAVTSGDGSGKEPPAP